jgi:hypothetical protein
VSLEAFADGALVLLRLTEMLSKHIRESWLAGDIGGRTKLLKGLFLNRVRVG